MIPEVGDIWARSEVGLSRLPVTEEIAGSNPVGPAIENTLPHGRVFSMATAHVELSPKNRGNLFDRYPLA